MVNPLARLERNHPKRFWRIADPNFSDDDWEGAFHRVLGLGSWVLGSNRRNRRCPGEKAAPSYEDSLLHFVNGVLLERQFGPNHWQLNRFKKLFYRLKPFIPRSVQIGLRQVYQCLQENGTSSDCGLWIADCEDEVRLKWPIEDRYVKFQYALIHNLMENAGVSEVPHVGFWPEGKDFAFVLTHDVETKEGFKAIPKLVKLEKEYSFHSVFNIVPERYSIDKAYLDELRAEGFEIGIHGLKHDGKLFFSKEIFSKRVEKINEYLKEYNAKGFRSPLTHRSPEWMQELECDYDMSFFDTDPYETMPGGTMSIWPFFMGHLVELPYTLVQDHTLLVILKETTPQIWLEKVDFIEKYKGMALVVVHPDYMRDQKHLAIYEEFLQMMRARGGYWHALPGEVARWWRARADAKVELRDGKWSVPDLPGATIARIKWNNGELRIES